MYKLQTTGLRPWLLPVGPSDFNLSCPKSKEAKDCYHGAAQPGTTWGTLRVFSTAYQQPQRGEHPQVRARIKAGIEKDEDWKQLLN
jgi:hypothetical protein